MSTMHVRPGEGRHYPMIDGDHIAKAAVRDAGGAFEVVGESARMLAITSGDGAGRFFADFADFAGSVLADRPVEESLAAILAVSRRHGVAGAEAVVP